MPNDLLTRDPPISAPPAGNTTVVEPVVSAALATEINRIETTERAVQDRRQQEELARQRELARFD